MKEIPDWLDICSPCKDGVCRYIDAGIRAGVFSSVREATRFMEQQTDGIWKANTLRIIYQRAKAVATNVANETKNKAELNTCTVQELTQLTEKFGTIYADPPWKYSNQATRSSTDGEYNTMTIEEICSLPVKELTAERAHLHLWTTNAFLFETQQVMESWGFEYKSVFLWIKPNIGIGNYWRVSHEFLLLGVKGGLRFADKSQRSWLECKRGRHSAKPEKIAHLIEKVSPGPYLELFGRKPRQNWTVWGNEIEKNLFYG